MEYEVDYKRYDEILQKFLDVMWRDPDELEIGVNISDIPEVKITFEGYGDLETEDENGEYEYVEGGNTNMESYAIFIHKDSGQEDFQFPEHEVFAFTFGRMIQHRPAEEVCIYAWYDVEKDEWMINSLYETSDHEMTDKEVMDILEILDKRWFSHDE